MACSGLDFIMDNVTLKMDVTRYFKISGTTHSATRRHIPEGCNLHEDICWPPMHPACLRDTNCLNYLHKPLYENQLIVRGGADESLARPGRKQAAATKLGIYPTYSPRSPIHFLARCSTFCKPLKKNQKFVRPTRSLQQQ
jgi:hypothetical protein